MAQPHSLSFDRLRTKLGQHFNALEDARQSGKIQHSLHDALMSAFACMYFQSPSLLQFQKQLAKTHQKSNLQTLFDVKTIPKESQMRSIIDEVDSPSFGRVFKSYYQLLQRGKPLEGYQLFAHTYYFPIDGTQYYSSGELDCAGCLVRRKDEAKRYVHQALQGGIMHPDKKQILPFMPESISQIDGVQKQDCETNA